MLLNYKTFKENGQAEIIEKKSRFIANTAVVFTEEEAQQFIAGIRKAHNNASHHVFAYRLEGPTILERQSDDGEPSGTAGMPILDVLRGNEIINGMIVVTRYFGGTLLGTGGLVRAYGLGAKEGVKAAGVVHKTLFREVSVKTDYSLSGKIQHEIAQRENYIKDVLYTENVEFIVLVAHSEINAFVGKMTDISAAGAEIGLGNEIYGAWWDKELLLYDH